MKKKLLALFSLLAIAPMGFAGELIFEDHFDRSESVESAEDPGNGWGTNSKKRAAGNKQVDLVDGAMHICRHKVADHGVSVVQDLEFKDATIKMRFKIGKGDELGINIADMNEKSVHAGHLCAARVRLNQVTIQDLKTGRMNLEVRNRFKSKTATDADKELAEKKQRTYKTAMDADTWHELKVEISDNTLSVSINDAYVGVFTSEGIGHATKSRIRLAVPKEAWVDDIMVYRD